MCRPTRKWITLWFIFIAFLSLAPLKLKAFLGTFGTLHYPAHFIAFALGALILLADSPSPRTRALRRLLILSFAALTELLEARLYHNPFEWADLAVDSFAVGLSPLLRLLCVSLWSSVFSV